MSYQTNYILLTIDVEDWFQVENFKQYIPFASWSSYELRVERNTHRLLDLLDSISVQQPFVPQACHLECSTISYSNRAKRSSSVSVLQHQTIIHQLCLPRVARSLLHCGTINFKL